MNSHKLIALFLVFMMVATACANISPSTPFANPTSITISAPTLIPVTPTVAAPTLEPSPTVDPNMPEGAIGKDAQGNWTKTENGVNVVWNTELNTWERHLNVNDQGIPLEALTQKSLDLGLHSLIWLHASVSDEVPGFEYMDSISFHPGANVDIGKSFRNQFIFDLTKRAGSNVTYQQLASGEVPITFTTSEGLQAWKLGPDTTVQVDILDKPIGNGFHDYKDIYGNAVWQVRMFTDEQGDLHLWVVLPPGISIDQLTKEQLMEIYLLAPASVISGQPVPRFSSELSTLVTLATDPGDPPFFDFTSPK